MGLGAQYLARTATGRIGVDVMVPLNESGQLLQAAGEARASR